MPSVDEGDIDSQTQANRFSTAVTDPNLDPVQFFNVAIPRISLSAGAVQSAGVSLNEVSSSTQALLSQLGAHSSQLSATLTQQTDEILRSGSRLAYEVEILRGDTIGLSETLTETLQDEIALFKDPTPTDNDADVNVQDETAAPPEDKDGDLPSNEPEYITKLRMLNQVKSRLEEVVAAFGEAMEWPIAPSELSVASSFISVSAPDAAQERQEQEAKGREIAAKLRAEVQSLLTGALQDTSRLAAAARRVEYLRTLAMIWKGTAEERARTKFVDSLAQLVEDRRRATGTAESNTEATVKQGVDRNGNARLVSSNNEKGGLFRNLQRLRDEIYLE